MAWESATIKPGIKSFNPQDCNTSAPAMRAWSRLENAACWVLTLMLIGEWSSPITELGRVLPCMLIWEWSLLDADWSSPSTDGHYLSNSPRPWQPGPVQGTLVANAKLLQNGLPKAIWEGESWPYTWGVFIFRIEDLRNCVVCLLENQITPALTCTLIGEWHSTQFWPTDSAARWLENQITPALTCKLIGESNHSTSDSRLYLPLPSSMTPGNGWIPGAKWVPS